MAKRRNSYSFFLKFISVLWFCFYLPCFGRDPALWPFEANDPWNHALGSGAQYTTITGNFKHNGFAGVNCTHWSHPVFIATASDPVHSITSPGFNGSIHVPANARPDPESDAHLHIIDETHTYVVETWGATVDGSGNISALAGFQNALKGPGVYPTNHGVRAYGGSAIGGLIRKGELTNGIPHALAISMYGNYLNRNGPGGHCYVWPASTCDGGNGSGYSSTGNLFMGSLLAIPPEVDITALGYGTSGPNYQAAKALQDYGGYIVDQSGGDFILYVEPAANSETTNFSPQAVVPLLKVVTNNTPTSIGGGGTPRRPEPPPFEYPVAVFGSEKRPIGLTGDINDADNAMVTIYRVNGQIINRFFFDGTHNASSSLSNMTSRKARLAGTGTYVYEWIIERQGQVFTKTGRMCVAR